MLVDVVVLSNDLELFDATRDAVGERNPVWRARSASESVDLLLTGRCGVLLLDLATVSTQPASLIRQIVGQFPDVVVVVAGLREDEPRLGPLLSDGLVYRFMHKPLSPKRAGMFLGAAIRCHAERRDSRARLRLLPHVGRLRRRLGPRAWTLLGVGLLLLAVLGALFTYGRDGAPGKATVEASTAPAAARSRPAPVPAAPPGEPRRRTGPGTEPRAATREGPRTEPRSTPRAERHTDPAPQPETAARSATGTVRPDPLAPVVTGRAPPARPVVSRGGSRNYGAPIASGHAIAGYAASAGASPGTDDPAADPSTAVAGVESRDLVALATPAPDYPPQALRDGLEGWVEVEFTVDARGATGDILVAASEPAGVFDAAATAAVAGWRYQPRVVNGRAVPQRTSVTLRFSVER